jgi:hypothetical protein
VPTRLPKIRKITLRLMNRPPGQASVIGGCATWHCSCGNPVALQGRSGPASGPTRESSAICEQCGRAYFVIPMDRSSGPPIEVVELFEAPPSDAPLSSPPETPSPSPAVGESTHADAVNLGEFPSLHADRAPPA